MFETKTCWPTFRLGIVEWPKLIPRYLDVVLENRAVEAVLTWGLYDGDSWLRERQPRIDGRPVRPLPFDEGLHPQPAVEAMIHAFGKRHG